MIIYFMTLHFVVIIVLPLITAFQKTRTLLLE